MEQTCTAVYASRQVTAPAAAAAGVSGPAVYVQHRVRRQPTDAAPAAASSSRRKESFAAMLDDSDDDNGDVGGNHPSVPEFPSRW